MEDLTDRQAADAVRSRLDSKYLLGLELTDPARLRFQCALRISHTTGRAASGAAPPRASCGKAKLARLPQKTRKSADRLHAGSGSATALPSCRTASRNAACRPQ